MVEPRIKKKPLLILGLCLCLFFMVAVKAQEARSTNAQIYVNATGSLGFQNAVNRHLQVSILTGFLNSSINSMRLTSTSGYFKWNNLNITGFRVMFTGLDSVQVAGDSGNDLRQINSGNTFTAAIGDRVEIIWSYATGWLLPVMFLMGIVGMCSLFGGSLYSVFLMKKGEYRQGLRQGIIFVALGIGLVLAWLWG